MTINSFILIIKINIHFKVVVTVVVADLVAAVVIA